MPLFDDYIASIPGIIDDLNRQIEPLETGAPADALGRIQQKDAETAQLMIEHLRGEVQSYQKLFQAYRGDLAD